MSVIGHVRRITVPDIASRKGGDKIVCLTAYSAATAATIDPYVDVLLVGDSVGMVLYGYDTTLPVTLEMMIAHGAAVVRGSERACVVVDLPYGAYQESPAAAFRASARVLAETGCAAVKLEGGVAMAETVAFLTARGVPVMGHIGLEPQSVMMSGGYRARGKSDDEAARLVADADAVAEAGAFALVIEGTMEAVARDITRRVPIPTIGIGASPACDGQVLVTEDIVGLSRGPAPKFVKRYADLGRDLAAAAEAFAADVRQGKFPQPSHCYGAGREATPLVRKTPPRGARGGR
ncbi:MAG: 3-methyl-2-oxobutanoate hydroxymethyltransferase [Alphaproteobacteria bacterium]